jgi:hypothetical protein
MAGFLTEGLSEVMKNFWQSTKFNSFVSTIFQPGNARQKIMLLVWTLFCLLLQSSPLGINKVGFPWLSLMLIGALAIISRILPDLDKYIEDVYISQQENILGRFVGRSHLPLVLLTIFYIWLFGSIPFKGFLAEFVSFGQICLLFYFLRPIIPKPEYRPLISIGGLVISSLVGNHHVTEAFALSFFGWICLYVVGEMVAIKRSI